MNHMRVFLRGVFLTSVCLLGFSAWGEPDGPPELPKRMRGVTTPEKSLDVDFFEMLAKTDVNVIRVGFSTDPNSTTRPTADNPLAPYRANLAVLDEAIVRARKAGLKIILCAANVYGCELDYRWQEAGDMAIFSDHLTAFWGAMAKRYLNEPVIVAYDILNEPNYPKGHDAAWYDIMLPEAVAAIRSVNTNIWLVVEPGNWGGASGFKKMLPLDDPYVIYSFHTYSPHSYCNQGILGYPDYSAVYPGTNSMWGPIDPTSYTYWDKEALRQDMQPVIDFAREYNVRILVGEFGVLRWAEGADQWLADNIELFEEYGWDWVNHGIGSWNGYSVTYSTDRGNKSDSTLADGGDRGARWQVLSKGWSLNRLDQNP